MLAGARWKRVRLQGRGRGRLLEAVLVASFLWGVLLAGCLGLGPHQEWQDLWEDCWTHSSDASATLVGVWESITAAGLPVTAPFKGVGVGNATAESLGTHGNITSVRWRLDGGSEPIGMVSYEGGRLTSPEYLEVRFMGSAKGAVPQLRGALDMVRTHEETVDLIISFLDRVRGPEPDNVEFAQEFIPVLEEAGGPPQPVPGPGESLPPSAGPVVLPMDSLRMQDLLEAAIDNITVRGSLARLSLYHEDWQWTVGVPQHVKGYVEDEAQWRFAFDAMDQVSVSRTGAQPIAWEAFLNETRQVLQEYGASVLGWDDWEVRMDVDFGMYCPPDEDE